MVVTMVGAAEYGIRLEVSNPAFNVVLGTITAPVKGRIFTNWAQCIWTAIEVANKRPIFFDVSLEQVEAE